MTNVRTRLLIVGFGIEAILLIALGFAYFRLSQHNAELRTQTRETSERMQAVVDSLKAQLRESRKLAAALDTPPPSVGALTSPPRSVDAGASHDPQWQAAIHKKMLRTNMWYYGEGIMRMHLDPKTATRLLELLTQRDEAASDAHALLQSSGVSNPQEQEEAFERATGEVERDIKTLLGESAHERLYAERQLKFERNEIKNGLAVEMYLAEVPLNDDQIESLAVIQMNSKPSANRPALSDEPNSSTGLGAREQAMVDAAAQVLTADQLRVFRDHEVDESQIEWAMNKGRLGAQ